MLSYTNNLGLVNYLKKVLAVIGSYSLFVADSFRWGFRPPFRYKQVIAELEFIGNQSLFIISLTAIFSGAVFAYTSWIGFRIVGTTDLVAPAVGLALLLEIGPILTALVTIGRAGGAMAAQLGTMKVTEQLDALTVMGIEAKNYLIAPKIIASILALPLLTAVFALVGNLGGYFVATRVCNIDPGLYAYKLKFYLTPMAFFHGFIKAYFFGFIMGSVACYRGYRTRGGASGVGKATNDAVVYAMVLVLVVDYFLTILIPTGIKSP